MLEEAGLHRDGPEDLDDEIDDLREQLRKKEEKKKKIVQILLFPHPTLREEFILEVIMIVI